MDTREALRNLVKWLDDSNLSRTRGGGVGCFRYEGTEYSVVTDAREALALADKQNASERYAAHCERMMTIGPDRDREFWRRLAGSVRKAAML